METAPDEWFRHCGTRLAYTYGAPARTIASCCSIGPTILKFAPSRSLLLPFRGKHTWLGCQKSCMGATPSYGSPRNHKEYHLRRFGSKLEVKTIAKWGSVSHERNAAKDSPAH